MKMMRALEVGDRVKTKAFKDFDGNERFPVGTIAIVTKIDNTQNPPICVNTNDDHWWYSADELELISELSAVELLQIVKEICDSSGCDDMCPLNEEGTGCLMRKTDFDPDKVLKACEQWKADHEQKEPEFEWIWQGRIYEIHDHDKGNFYQLKDGKGFYDTGCLNEESAEEYMAEVLKDYRKNHKGEFVAVVTHVCRVKR